MAEETTISTPVETSDTSDTVSEEVTNDVTTSEDTPETGNETAETETDEQTQEQQIPKQVRDDNSEKLYAGKYKNVEELEKGYSELNKAYTQANQIKAKYDELLKQQQQQAQIDLQNAQKAGYNSVDEQNIANNVTMAEFNAFWANLGLVNAEAQPTVQQYLTEYYKTGDKDYLKAAKAYYSSDFLEKVAIGKVQLEDQLKNELTTKQTEQKNQREMMLADTLKTDFAEFLADVKENEGKARALKAFCDAEFIQSREDMQIFADIYKQIADTERAAAIKEYEAQKVIEETKKKASIDTNGQPVGVDIDNNIPSADEMRADPSLYRKAVKKYGMDKVDTVLMKG